MYINPFVAGILTTVFVEVFIIILAAIHSVVTKGGRNERD